MVFAQSTIVAAFSYNPVADAYAMRSGNQQLPVTKLAGNGTLDHWTLMLLRWFTAALLAILLERTVNAMLS